MFCNPQARPYLQMIHQVRERPTYLDTSGWNNDVESNGIQDAALINTVVDKISNYSVKDYKLAEIARKIQNTIGRPYY